jgi:hypothetical protein
MLDQRGGDQHAPEKGAILALAVGAGEHHAAIVS